MGPGPELDTATVDGQVVVVAGELDRVDLVIDWVGVDHTAVAGVVHDNFILKIKCVSNKVCQVDYVHLEADLGYI